MKRFCMALLGACLLGALAPAAAQEAYPSRTVRIVDGFPAGGSTDALARFIATRLGDQWGSPVIVENRSGASGQIGAASVARSEPDGYNFFVAPNPDILITGPLLYKDLPYNVEEDFIPVAVIADVPLVLTVRGSHPAKTAQQLIELAKASPGKLTYGSAGQGTVHHLSAAMFTSLAGIDMLHVPYKGTAPAVQDLLGGHVDVVISPITAVLPHIQQGTLRALGVAASQPVNSLPGVPAMSEVVPGYEGTLWISLIGPKGMPEAIMQRWNKAVAEVMASPAAHETFVSQGIVPAKATPLAEIQARMSADSERWAKVIRDANITIQ